jgi:choline dehydrogenase
MVAERAADLIRGMTTLPPSSAPVIMSKNWKKEQRTNKPNRKVNK